MADNSKSQKLADEMIFQTMLQMEERGVSFEVMIDRLVTAAGAQVARREGSPAAADLFRQAAKAVDDGLYARIDRRSVAN